MGEMQDKTDAQLLRDYAERGSESAFSELVRRHTAFVYSAAWRQVGSTDLACEIAQIVFTDLSRKASTLAGTFREESSLAGWLHRSTRYAALYHLRTDRRRLAHERQAMEQFLANSESESDSDSGSAADWERIRPVLDEAMAELSDPDRDALLLRFFKNQDFRDVGAALGLSDDAAQKRVTRALEKLRVYLTHRGSTTTAAALSILLSANARQLAPVGLAGKISAAALAGAAAGSGTTLALTLIKFMASTKLKLGIAALLIVGAFTTVVHQRRLQVEEIQSLQRQVAQLQSDNEDLSNRAGRSKIVPVPNLPTPPMQTVARAEEVPSEPLPARNLYAWLTDRASPVKLTTAQTETYLKEHRRSAASLLAAFRTSEDPALLQEATEKYPKDPQVAFEAAVRRDASPAERRQWLDALKQSAPDNALANYLSAAEHFKAGQADLAVLDLIAAGAKPQFLEYNPERIQTDEEAYRGAGYPEAEAKLLASSQLPMGQQASVNELGRSLLDLAKSYRQAGDETSRQAALQMAADLGQRYGDDAPGQMLVAKLLGISIERRALGAMDATTAYGTTGQTVQDRLTQLGQQREGLAALTRQADPIMQSMTDPDWISFNDRLMLFGEEAAMRWLIGKHGP